MTNGAGFWNRIAARYARTPIKDEVAYEHKLGLTREVLDPSHQVLELGCGTGGTAVRHAPLVDRITAVDISSKMVAIARERAVDAGVTNVDFQVSALESFDAPAETYDVVLALSLLHLVSDRDAAISRIRDLLKPGGVFISNTACLAGVHGWLRFLGPLGRMLGLLPLVRVFSESDLRASLEAAEFDVELCWKPDGKSRYVVFLIARRRAEANAGATAAPA